MDYQINKNNDLKFLFTTAYLKSCLHTAGVGGSKPSARTKKIKELGHL